MRFLTGLLCSTLAGTLVCVGASRADDEDAREIAERIQESRKVVIEAESQKRRILGSLYGIQQRMKKISRDKGNLTDDLFQVQDNVKSIAKLIATLEMQIDQQRAHLRIRLRALYKLSGESYVGILFSAGSSHELDETLRFMKIVADNDYQLIKSYQHNVKQYKVQKDKLRGQIERLVSLEKNIKKQESLLAGEHKAKSRIVSELDRESRTSLAKLKNLRSRTQGLAKADAWSDLLKPSIYEQKGQLPLPVRARVAQDFGLITDDKYKTRLSHKGWRLAAQEGAEVASIFDGTVVHADWMDGYGQTVVLDHGDHYYSVYAHIARLKVQAGDTVKKGQVFATVETGMDSRRAPASASGREGGVYFEIRHFSEPENPSAWIARNPKQQPDQIANEQQTESQ